MHNHVQHASVFILTPPFAPPLRRTALALLLAGCFGAAQANPALPQVVNGQATFNQQGNIFSITNTPNTIINWQSFSIHAGEITRFIQQSGNSAVLNRITGHDPSKILGSLESNGKVFLINPNGIVFGQGARVDVNGLVASSLGMTNEDFLAGKRQFTAGGVAGGVGNAGTINAGKGGQVLLIAPNVENTGIITAPNGEVILAAGRSVQLADPGNPQLRVLVSAPTDQALNLGQIIAQGGSIGMAGALLSQRGVLNANSAIVGDNGRIVLKASGKALLEAGSVTSATGATDKGGDIQVLGEKVGLLGNAKVDASGAAGGGTVLLGGDYQGKNAAVQNARQVLVGKDASIHADAIVSGNGGKVIAWGNESAQVHGSISARGGAQGGDGGFVETSGHYLAVDGIRVNTSAAHGKRGNWLLDPYDITVIAGSDGQLGDVDQFADAPSTGNASIGADLISGASSNVTLQATHRINFNSAINIMQQGVGLTAQAGETINVNASISTNGGAVRLLANDASSGSVGAVGSHVNLAAPITSNGGSVYLSGAGVSGAGVVNVGSGHLSLISNFQGGAIDLTGSGDQLQGSGIAGQTVILQADNIGINGTLNFGGTAGGANVIIKPLSSARSIDLGTKSGSALSLDAIELAGISAASLTIGDGTNTGGMRISDALARTGDLHLNSGSAITATSAVTVDGSFVLDGGNWVQNAAVLPGFSARSFAIGSGASFLRAVGGDGGASSPYLIADIHGLQGIGSLGFGNSYRLAGNIDASGTANWNDGQGFVPIAGSGGGFSGVFDGGGFTLSNLKIDRSGRSGSAAGLFGTVQGGTLRNLTLSGGSVTGTANVGALAGEVVSGSIDGVNSSTSVSGQRNVGGLVGSNGGAITMSSSSGAVTGVNADGGGAIGGLAGWNASSASITTSYATGVVTGAREMIGGLVGNNQGALSQSYATGNVTGARSIGGLVGLNGGSIDDAYASGAVGRAGVADPILAWENMGGLVGESTGSVSHVFSSGAVTGNGYAAVGAVAGRVASGSPFSYGFFNYETSLVQMDGGGSSGRSTAQMQQQGSFNDYNFGSTWRIYEGYTTPMLKAFLKPLQVNLSGNAAGKVYDGQLAAFLGAIGYVGLLDGDTGVNGSLGYGNARNVGSYAATGLWSTKYDITMGGTTTFAITPRALTVSIGGNGKIYDGTLGYDGVNFVLGNVVAGDNISISGSAAFLDKNAGGSKAVHASGLALGDNELGNYSLAATTADGTAAITARVLNYSVTGAQSRVYDGTVQAGLNGYFEGMVSGDQVGMAGLQGSFRDKHVGTDKTVDYQVATGQLTGADAGNYVLNGNAGSTTADITARTLNVSFNGVNKTYDGTTDAQVNFGDDRIQGDALTVAGNAVFGNKKAGVGKAVHVTNVGVSGDDAGNYVLNRNAGNTTADIAARTLNVSFNGVNKTYDGTTGAQVNFGDDRIQGDALSVAGNAAFGNKNAGNGKAVTVTNVGVSGDDAGNYVLVSNAGITTADIVARTLNVSFNGVNKTYDGTTDAQVNFGDDRIQGDALSVAGNAAFGNKNTGSGKAVTVTNVGVSGDDAGNYVLGTNAGSTTADITARTLTVSFNGVNKTYDGTTGAQVTFGDDRIQGDVLTVAGNAAFGNKNAGSGKAVTVTNVALGGDDAGNYVLVTNAGSTTADIAARTLNVSFNGVNKTYDGTTGAQVNFGDDRIQGDVLTLAGNAAFGNKKAGVGKAVHVTNVGVSGDDAGNYVLNRNAGNTTADIGARALNLSGVVGNKVYDGTTGAQLSLGDDRVAGDSLVASAVANFADKNVGVGKAVQLAGAALTGADADNYFIVLPTGLLASITPASLTLVGLSASGKVYDGSTNAAVSATASGVLGQDVVSVVGGSGSFADKNAGAAKLVTASGFRLAGADAGNYTLETTGGTAQASIAQKQLSTWVGSGSGLWSDAANWDGGVVPEGANVLAVDFSNSKGIVTYSAAAGSTILKNLNSATGLLLTGGSLTLGESALDLSVLGGLAGLEISGGSLLLNGSLSADRYAQGGGLLSGNGNLLVANSFNQAAGAIRLAGQLAITQAAGDLRFASLAANEVKLSALNGAIGQDGALLASSVTAQARDGIVLGHAGNQVGSFTASNSAGGGIALNNTSAPGTLTLGTLTTGAGNIAIDNTGGVTAGNINANGGNVSVTAHSPVIVNGRIAGNDIALDASTDVVLGDGAQLAAVRNVSMTAGRDINVGGNAQIAGGGNVSASAGANVRFADTASVTLPAAASMSMLAKTGSITGDAGVRINRQRSGVTLLAPNGTVSMADAIFLSATTIDKPVIDAATSAAIDDALRIIKQADRANDTLVSAPQAKPDDKKKDSKDVAEAKDKPTGYKLDDAAKKMYCN
ncbi:YDG domain-containing protein [Janthinobacterium sp. BJB401]|uniref:YDG domain-containing protein n=1 Tax=Janthinobacterium sp. BJB401 TaxID=2745934 RepID=UPI001595D3CF|nr:YDG domain-containing protein [Janthinobacterium sp. BJB401]NVI83510.1 filamentous hemagglutinin N-terminal domain-containing protein [Janthinobacterium sp. BJB401]